MKIQTGAWCNVRVVLFEEIEGTWVAQGLELDIAAQGKSVGEAWENFKLTFAQEVALRSEGKAGLISKAPQKYWDMWEEANIHLA